MTTRGMAQRGICPVCGAERALRKSGTIGSHQRAVRSGTGRFTYTTGQRCPGVDQLPVTEPAADGPSRGERRHPDKAQLPPTPATRGKTTGLIGYLNPFTNPVSPNDMRPRDVDRKLIKKRRKAAANNRRKRKS